jgi:type II secretory pathway component PulF
MKFTLAQKTMMYQKLYAGYKAGLPLDMLVHTAQLSSPSVTEGLRSDISEGKSLSASLLKRKLVAPWEARLLAVGETSGRLETVLLELQLLFEARSRQLRSIKSRLLYPYMLFLAAVFIPPLPQLAAGTLDVGVYLFTGLLQAVVVFVAYRILLARPLESGSNVALNDRLAGWLRWVSADSMLRETVDVAYLNLLTMCLDAGLDAAESLKLLKDNSSNKALRSRHQKALAMVHKHGLPLAQVLTTQGLVQHPQVVSFLHSSEQSGTLHSALRDFLARKRGEIELNLNHLLQRLCRWLYIMVILFAVTGII